MAIQSSLALQRGEQGGQIILSRKFQATANGEYIDDDLFASQNILPRVQIINPQGQVVADSTAIGAMQPIRIDVGQYEYIYPIDTLAEISDNWTITWTMRVNGSDRDYSNNFGIVSQGTLDQPVEFRVGYAFNNPDTTSTRLAYAPIYSSDSSKVIGKDGWGILVHPDELRGLIGFGFKLTSPGQNQTYDDNMLYWYIEQAITGLERDLNIDIYPRIVRYADPVNASASVSTTASPTDGSGRPFRVAGDKVKRVDIPEGEENIQERGYPWRSQNAQNFLYIKLRRRPLIDCLNAVIVDPTLRTTTDIYAWRREGIGLESTLQFSPSIASGGVFAYAAGMYRSPKFFNIPNLPDAILIDYRTGYLKAAEVPPELRQVVMWIAGYNLLNDFGDGVSPGLASASVNLNSISESYGTTSSATSAIFGARMISIEKLLKQWWERNKNKYQHASFGML